MADRRIIFPDDHPYYPGKSLVIPEGATQEQIDEVIGSLSKPSGLDTAKSYGKAVASGMVRGAADVPDTALMSSGVATPLSLDEQSMLGVSAPTRDDKTGEVAPSDLSPVFGQAAEPYLHKSASPGEELASAAGSGVVSGLLGPGAPARTAISNVPRVIPWATKMAHYGVLPSVAGEKVRQMTEGVHVPGWVPGIGGKDISTAAGMITAMFSPAAVRGKITPRTVTDPTIAQRYRTATEAGYPVTAGELAKDPRYVNEELAARPIINKEKKDSFNRIITNEIGEPTDSITGGGSQSYLGRNFKRIGNDYNRLEATTSINPNIPGSAPMRNPQVYNDLVNIASRNPHHVKEILDTLQTVNPKFAPTKYAASAVTPQEAIHDAIFRTAGTGGSYTLPGNEYRQLRTALYSAAESHASPQVANSLRGVAHALDEAMERGLPPEMQGQWNRTNRQYAHALVAQDAIGGQKAGARQMTPDQFKASSQRVMGREPYLRRDLEQNVFGEAAGEFPSLKKTDLPPPPPLTQKVASWVPYGQNVVQAAPLIGGAAGLALGYMKGKGFQSFEPGVWGYLMGEGGRQYANRIPSPYANAMNPLVQMYRKNQLLPKLPEQAGRRQASTVARALFGYNQGNQEGP